LGYKYRT